MPGGKKGGVYPPYRPKNVTVKAVGSMRKILKDQNKLTLTHLEKLLEDSYYIQSPYGGVPEDVDQLLNGDSFPMRDSSREKLREKFTNNIHTLLWEIPEYVAEVRRKEVRKHTLEWAQDRACTHWEPNYKQGYGNNSYEVNKNRAGFEACVEAIWRQNPNRSSEWYDEVSSLLAYKDKFTLTFDASEHISTYSHTSCWSYWAVLTFEYNGETISSGKTSYRESEVNRV